MQFSILQARLDQLDVSLRGGDASLCLLLESVQHVHHADEAHGINRPVGVAVEVIDQFQNGTAAKSLRRCALNHLIA
jgi:hypothetical protein